MSSYMIGDVQGCDAPLAKLLEMIDFSPSRDTLYVLGDLINRGPENLATLNRLIGYGTSAVCLLGNHDIHFLGIECGLRSLKTGDTLNDVLSAWNKDEIVSWLRSRPLAVYAHDCLMVHAGVYPSWDLNTTLTLAKEIECELGGPDWVNCLTTLFGNTPSTWNNELIGTDRQRAIVNALTRMRFCSATGEMEFGTKGPAANAPFGYFPWFAVPGRLTQDVLIAFGHWSALNPNDSHDSLVHHNVMSLDTGCVWGGCLTSVELGPENSFKKIQVNCEQSDQTIKRVKVV